MSFTLKFTLKQHTPILHFQHDQPGATLRATEVKPKLDRFLIQQLSLSYITERKWLIGDGVQNALDYKIKVINGEYNAKAELPIKTKNDKDGKLKYITAPEMYPQVLANMGGKDSEKELKMFRMYDYIKVEIFSFHEDLLTKISELLPLFFATHNFGNRQSKGFGSFYLDKSDPLYKPPGEVLMISFDKLIYWQWENEQHFDDTFEDIDILYRIIKAGFNFPDHPKGPDGRLNLDNKKEFATYQSSFLKNYFLKEHQIGSEKRAIKESLFQPNLRIPKDSSLKGNYYNRAILGTSEFFEYRDKRRGKVEIKSDEVERFQSAITFKVFSDRVYLLPGDWSMIRGKKFIFKTERDSVHISAPTVNFDLLNFLTEFATWFNNMKDDEVERLEDVIEDNRKRPEPDLIKRYRACLKNVMFKTLQKRTEK